MNSAQKKNKFGIHVGSASMLLIFVILCLVSFAALSIVSANADKRLSNKIADRTLSYYEACNSAESALAGIDKVLVEQYKASPDEESYFKAVGHNKSYVISVSETQTLCVEIEILYPKTAEDTFYRITSWQVVQEDQP